MGMWIGRNRKARVTYGFDEIALVPGQVTINPNEVDITWRLGRKDAAPLEFKIPILASAMDGVVDVKFAIAMGQLGGLAVLHLQGLQTRYNNPAAVPQQTTHADTAKNTARPQKLHQEPAQATIYPPRVQQTQPPPHRCPRRAPPHHPARTVPPWSLLFAQASRLCCWWANTRIWASLP